MLEFLERVGSKTSAVVQEFGKSGIFLWKIIVQKPMLKRLWPAVWDQLYFIGVLSFLIIVVSALFIGMVVGLQGYHTLQKFGADSELAIALARSGWSGHCLE